MSSERKVAVITGASQGMGALVEAYRDRGYGVVATARSLACAVRARFADDARLANYGRHLAQECTSCLRPDA